MGAILVCGDRYWNDYPFINRHIMTLPPDTVIIHGNCGGADQMAGLAANALGLRVRIFGAEWSKYGRAAGPIRNRRMLNVGKPDEVWAFHDHLDRSRGTLDMMRVAADHNLPVQLFSHALSDYPTNWVGVNANGCPRS